MREYLAAQKNSHPELSAALLEMDRIVERIDSHVAPATAKIQPPSFVARLNEDFRKNVLDSDTRDDIERCKASPAKFGLEPRRHCVIPTGTSGRTTEESHLSGPLSS